MCICDSSYPRKLAFSYLDELSKEFQRSYEGKIETASRPYAFMGFGKLHGTAKPAKLIPDTFISKTTRLYRDSRTLTQAGGGPAAPASQLDQLNENLQDVTRIMTKNMEDLLWRGDSLDRKSDHNVDWTKLTERHVTSIHIASSRVCQIPKSRPKHQPASATAQMGSYRRYRFLLHSFHVVEVLLRRTARFPGSTTTYACNDYP